METLSFDLGHQTVKITTSENVTPRRWQEAYDQISALVDHYNLLLSIDYADSEINRFNSLAPHVPSEFDPQFVSLLKYNWDLAARSQFKFQPFEFDSPTENLGEIVKLDVTSLTKLMEVKFRPSLLGFLLVEEIERLMRDLEFGSYLISFSRIFVARGPEMWKVEFEHPIDSSVIEMDVINTCIFMDTRKLSQVKYSKFGKPKFKVQFANKSTNSDLLALIVTGDSPTHSFVTSQVLLHSQYAAEVEAKAKGMVKQVWLIYEDGEIAELFDNPLLQSPVGN